MTSCEKLRAGANIRQSADIRMRELSRRNGRLSVGEYIAIEKVTQGTETSKYLEEEKEKSISKVAASGMERGQTTVYCGVVDHHNGRALIVE